MTLPGSRQNEAEFHPGQLGLCNHNVALFKSTHREKTSLNSVQEFFEIDA